MMCDLTIAAENAIFGQTGPKVGSFDGGWGASYMARIVGQKKAREIWFLCRQYDAQQALDMGLVNTVVPLADLEKETVRWCREMLQNSPMALRCLKAALNADYDGQAGLQELAGNATMLFYMTEEGQEGRNAFNQKRQPDFSKFKRRSIMRVSQVYRWQIPMDAGVVLRERRLKTRDGLFIRLQEGEREGWGEISPLPGFSVETLEEAQMALLAWAQAWRDGAEPPLPHAALRRVWHQLRAGGA